MRNLLPTKSHGRTAPALVLLGLFAAAGVSCGGAPTSARLYTLKVPDAPRATSSAAAVVIGVEHFSADTPILDRRILRYDSPTQLKYYDEDRWVSDPTTLIPELAARILEQMGIARQARVFPWVESMDYVLQGQIVNFEEVVSGDEHEARVGLELTLRRFPGREMVWSGIFRAQQPVADDNIEAVVDALSAATDQVLKEAFTQLAKSLPQ